MKNKIILIFCFILGLFIFIEVFKSKSVNAITPIYENKEEPKYNVMSYGAKGDWNGLSGTDDTKAIQAAIDAAYEDGSGVVEFPSGGKFIAKNIIIKSGILIEGNGSVIVNDSKENQFNNPTFNVKGKELDLSTLLAQDIKGGAGADTVPVMIKVKNVEGFKVGDDIKIEDKNGSEFNTIKAIDGNRITLKSRPVQDYLIDLYAKITKIELVKNVTIKDLVIEHMNTENSIVIDYATNLNINNLISENSVNGIVTNNVESITIESCRITTAGIGDSSHGISLGKNTRYSKVANCSFYYGRPAIVVAGDGIIINDNNIIGSGAGLTGDGITIWGSDNVISNNTITGGDCYGIWISEPAGYNTNRNQILNNVIESNITVGVYVNGGADNSVCNNTLRKNSNGISVNDSSGCIVDNNVIVENSNIGIALFSNNNIVTGNRCHNNSNYQLYMYDEADYCIIKDNIIDGMGAIHINSNVNNIVHDNIVNGVPSY